MSEIEAAIQAHRRMLDDRAERDVAIKRALDMGVTAYALAQSFHLALGANALTAEGIRKIAVRTRARAKAKPEAGEK